jgi:F-type H+-transporting ATPase subunit delta
MAEIVTVARPYAEAAFKLAQETGNLAAWSDMLELIEAVVRDPAIASRINDPSVDPQALEGAILGTVGDRVHGHARNLIQVLVQNGRLDLITHIRALYDARRREHEGVLEARIISAMRLSDEQVRQLVETLERKYERKVTAEVEVDPELIGGARIVVGDKVIDATVRGRLDAMAAALAN